MTKLITSALATTLAFASFSLAAQTDDEQRYQHFQPEPSETITQALDNIKTYNEMLQELTSGELTPTDMAKIHELSYTLEVALAKLSEELENAAVSLEEVHLGSEELNKARVLGNAEIYLEITNDVTGQ